MHRETTDFTWPSIFGVNPKKVSRESKIAFFSAVIMGSITHIYIFTNLLLNHDSSWRIFYDNNNLALGRWFLQFASDPSTQFQLPVVIGLISILVLALTAGLTVKILSISNTASIILISGFIVTFPPVACIFSYMYTADAYFIALLLNTLAVFVAKKYKYGFVGAIILMAFACGIYQAFICYAVGLFLFDCMISLLDENVSVKKVIVQGIKYVASSVAALLIYYAVLHLLLAITGTTLSSYQGIDSVGLSSIKAFLKEIPTAYETYYDYFLNSAYSSGVYQVINILVHAVFYLALAYLVFSRKVYKDIVKVLLLVSGVALIPLALNLITILSAGAWVHELMVYSFVLQFVFTIVLVEMIARDAIRNGGKTSWKFMFVVNALLCGLLVWNNFCVSNTAYLRMQVAYENSYALVNRIVSRIESVEGYSRDMPVAIVGLASTELYGGTVSEFRSFNSLTGANNSLVFQGDPHIRTRSFIEDYIGIRMKTPSQAQKTALSDSGVIEQMPSYPTEGSVAVHDGIIVVKLSDGTIR